MSSCTTCGGAMVHRVSGKPEEGYDCAFVLTDGKHNNHAVPKVARPAPLSSPRAVAPSKPLPSIPCLPCRERVGDYSKPAPLAEIAVFLGDGRGVFKCAQGHESVSFLQGNGRRKKLAR